MWCRYRIKYSASDFSGAAASPVTIDITFVEVALVTGSFLFIAQADSIAQAQQHAAHLYTAGTDANTAITTDLATVLQMWLMSAASTYVNQMTTHLGADAYTVAAVNTLELGLFSAVVPADVIVLSASIDWSNTATLNTNSSSASQKYAFNVTVQVAVLTSNMLQSVYVDVLPNLDVMSNPAGRRRLCSSSDSKLVDAVLHSTGSAPPLQTASDIAAASSDFSKDTALSLPRTPQQAGSTTARTLGLGTAWAKLHAQARSLSSTGSSSSFPLASLLTFKQGLVLAAFDGTTGCNASSLTALFYKDSRPPADFSDVCVGSDSSADHSMNAAFLASSSASVPLLQVCYISCLLDFAMLHMHA